MEMEELKMEKTSEDQEWGWEGTETQTICDMNVQVQWKMMEVNGKMVKATSNPLGLSGMDEEFMEHLYRYCPKRYKALKEAGTLIEEVKRTVQKAKNEVIRLITGPNALRPHEAREIVYPQTVLSPPESQEEPEEEVL